MVKMKKVTLVVLACMAIGMVFSSCRTVGHCPAYSLELILK